MKRVINYFNVLLGCLIVAVTINLVLIPNEVLTFGIDGLACILHFVTHVNPAFNMLLLNLMVVLAASLFLDRNVLKVYLLPAILIPLCVFITGASDVMSGVQGRRIKGIVIVVKIIGKFVINNYFC